MIDLNDTRLWSTISSNLAQKYRVLPLRFEGECVVFVAGNFLTPVRLEQIRQLLSIRLHRDVIVEPIEAHREFASGVFDTVLRKYLGVLPAPSVTLPVGSDMMTVLLILNRSDHLTSYKESLTAEGYTVFAFENCDDALAYLKSKQNWCRPGRIIVSPDLLAAHTADLDDLAQLLSAELSTRLPTGEPILHDSFLND